MIHPSARVVSILLVAGVAAMACGAPGSGTTLWCPAHELKLPKGLPLDQSTLYPDANKIISYGVAHPDVYGGFEYIGTTHPEFRVAFTRDVAAIRSALDKTLHYPDRIQFVTGKYTLNQLRAIQQKVLSEVPEAILWESGRCFSMTGWT